MLVSHQYKFIFLKTVKTAGTSVELALEPYCRTPDLPPPSEVTGQIVSAHGIVGARGQKGLRAEFYNHMTAKEIRKALGKEVWDTYTKITVVRNPFDKTVSWFWMNVHESIRANCANDFEFAADTFRKWLKVAPTLPIDKGIYTINGVISCDIVLRYETLIKDFNEATGMLGIEGEVDLGHNKGGARRRPEEFKLYYDDASKDVVARHFKFEIRQFEYQFDDE